jgi:hypothetical protein
MEFSIAEVNGRTIGWNAVDPGKFSLSGEKPDRKLDLEELLERLPELQGEENLSTYINLIIHAAFCGTFRPLLDGKAIANFLKHMEGQETDYDLTQLAPPRHGDGKLSFCAIALYLKDIPYFITAPFPWKSDGECSAKLLPFRASNDGHH